MSVKNILIGFIVLVLGCAMFNNVQGQTTTDTIVIKKHSPKKATYLSLIPGAGQIYNKKYWKLPIVYAGFGVTGYFALWNRNGYLEYNDAYICKIEEQEQSGYECDNELAQKYSADQIKSVRDQYRRDMEFSFILMGLWYVLQILDATVDAHLYYWDVNENLSVRVQPIIKQQFVRQPAREMYGLPAHNGVKISVNF
ncbi:MAG: hypothetical protein HOL96_00435 [Lentimicrobiaceae bacterium]|jgi:hypothetical protein|nr:hypothetical protein [Lentimicrobiaceae bacterium]